MNIKPTKWTDYKTHLIGHGKYGSITLTGADARKKRAEIRAKSEVK
jgi:hypothetical protein